MSDLGSPGVKKLRLRYAAVCATCEIRLPAGAAAWWSKESKVATCLSCGSGELPIGDLAVAAGASARQKHARLQEAREARVKSAYGNRLGKVVLALSDEPASTRAWAVGAVGEERLAHHLERELPSSAVVLHDRRIPGSRANIDHIVITSSGVWAIDSKLYKGKVEARTLGPIWRREQAVFVGGRNRTSVVDGMRKQTAALRGLLSAEPGDAAIPIFAAVCFVASDWSLFARPFVVNGVLVTWPKALVKSLLSGDVLGVDESERVARRIAVGLPAAVRR